MQLAHGTLKNETEATSLHISSLYKVNNTTYPEDSARILSFIILPLVVAALQKIRNRHSTAWILQHVGKNARYYHQLAQLAAPPATFVFLCIRYTDSGRFKTNLSYPEKQLTYCHRCHAEEALPIPAQHHRHFP